jgi:hypothetical protein
MGISGLLPVSNYRVTVSVTGDGTRSALKMTATRMQMAWRTLTPEAQETGEQFACLSDLPIHADVAPRTGARRDAGWISRELKMFAN